MRLSLRNSHVTQISFALAAGLVLCPANLPAQAPPPLVWGISRLIDGIQIATRDPINPLPLDTGHSAVTGCSYAGKMAMWGGAFDERIALTISQENGGGGAPSWRISHEIETQGSVDTGTSGMLTTASIPGTWSFSPPAGTVLSPGMNTVTATFTPANLITSSTTAANAYKTYTIATASVPILVGTVTIETTGALSTISGGYRMVVTVQNTGNVTASNVQLTQTALGAATGGTIPATLGDIASGGSASVTLTFPSTAGADGARVVEKLSGTYNGGTFGGSFRAVLP
jgi:hypothetical protein